MGFSLRFSEVLCAAEALRMLSSSSASVLELGWAWIALPASLPLRLGSRVEIPEYMLSSLAVASCNAAVIGGSANNLLLCLKGPPCFDQSCCSFCTYDKLS
jgi:hypothetical protein